MRLGFNSFTILCAWQGSSAYLWTFSYLDCAQCIHYDKCLSYVKFWHLCLHDFFLKRKLEGWVVTSSIMRVKKEQKKPNISRSIKLDKKDWKGSKKSGKPIRNSFSNISCKFHYKICLPVCSFGWFWWNFACKIKGYQNY